MTVLARTQTVLERTDEEMPTFCSPERGPDARDTLVILDRAVWKDMGSPETVTVTVEPGDQLNDPERVPEFGRVRG